MKRSLQLILVAATVTVALLLITTFGSADDKAKPSLVTRPTDRAGAVYKHLAELTKRVEKLERSSLGKASHPVDEELQVQIFDLQYANADSMTQIVQKLFAAPEHKSLRLTFDSRTNSVLAYGAKSDLEVMEAILMKLDVPVENKTGE